MNYRAVVCGVLGVVAGYVYRETCIPSQPEAAKGSTPSKSVAATQQQTTAATPEEHSAAGVSVAPSAAAAQIALGEKRTAELQARLQELGAQQETAQKKLVYYQAEIGDLRRKLGLDRTRNEFDLTKEDWAELQKENLLKYRMPCGSTHPLTEKTLEEAGLAPDDGEVIDHAFEKSQERQWAVIGPMCAKAIDATVEVARRVGLDACQTIAMDYAFAHDNPVESFQRISGFRAGKSPLPEKLSLFDQLALSLTGELASFEADLAATFGPEQAHDLVYSKGLCLSNSTYKLNGASQ